MQSAPREIQDDLEEEPVALSEEELPKESEVKNKEEIAAEAKIKAEEEEVAASMREIAHRAKERAVEEKDSLEESIQAPAADAEADWVPSEQEEEFVDPSKKKEENSEEVKKTNPSLQLPNERLTKKNISEQKAIPAKSPLSIPKSAGAPMTPVSLSSLEVELLFVLGQHSISIEELRSLGKERIIPLGGADFQASIFLQGKKIAEAQLVMVDKAPSLQITRIIEG